MLAMSDTGALLRFVQRPNAIDLATSQDALQARGRYSELVALLAARDGCDAALDLLRQLSQAPEELPVPPEGACSCLLQACGPIWSGRREGVPPALAARAGTWLGGPGG